MNKAEPIEASGMHKAVCQVGDRWSLLIVWMALHGTTRFDDFHLDLGVARNVLSDRLNKLVDVGVMARRPIVPGARRMEYRPTARGEALRPALERIDVWGQQWAD